MGRRRTTGQSGGGPRTLHGAPVAAELDLHGMRAAQAELRVESFLRAERVRVPGEVVRIITGKGSAGGPPVLKGLVRDILEAGAEGAGDFSWEVGGGSVLVRLRG